MKHALKHEFEHGGRRVEISASFDALTPTSILEVKCVSCLAAEHALQLIVYGWLWHVSPQGAAAHGPRRLFLLNVRTDELREVESEPASLEKVVRALLDGKDRAPNALRDDQFVACCAAPNLKEHTRMLKALAMPT